MTTKSSASKKPEKGTLLALKSAMDKECSESAMELLPRITNSSIEILGRVAVDGKDWEKFVVRALVLEMWFRFVQDQVQWTREQLSRNPKASLRSEILEDLLNEIGASSNKTSRSHAQFQKDSRTCTRSMSASTRQSGPSVLHR